MFAILQIPILDFRSVTGSADAKLTNPSWPSPKLNRRPFIRRFGNVQKRTAGGMEDWLGEEYFCEAGHSLQYVELQKQRFAIDGQKSLLLKSVYRRFFSDGQYFNKIEIALRNRDIDLVGSDQQALELKVLFKHYLQIPVKVGGKTVKLYRAGQALAELFNRATTRHSAAGNKAAGSLVQDGELCMLAIIKDDDRYGIPPEAKLIDTYKYNETEAAIELYGYTVHLDGYYIKSWIIRVPRIAFKIKTAANAILRKLRINLMRIHTEKEIIRGAFNAAQQKLIDMEAPGSKFGELTKYLDATSKKLFANKREGIDRENMLDFALRSEEAVDPAGTLVQMVEKLNGQFLAKTMQKFADQSKPVDKKTVLFMCSNPMNTRLLNFGEEFKVVEKLHESSLDRANFQVLIRTGMERKDVTEQLVKLRPDILHISLHASKDGGLYFQDASRNADPIQMDEWKRLITLQHRIHKPSIVILSACNSIDFAKAAREFVDFSVGTIMLFPDEAGVEYARGFYTILFNDENTSYEVCHQAGLDFISSRKPPFDLVNDTEVRDIICSC